MTAPLRVEQVLDGTTWAVMVTISPDHAHVSAGELTITLTPEQADNASRDLYEVAQEPDRCQYDDLFANVTVDGIGLCGFHAAAHDDTRAQATP